MPKLESWIDHRGHRQACWVSLSSYYNIYIFLMSIWSPTNLMLQSVSSYTPKLSSNKRVCRRATASADGESHVAQPQFNFFTNTDVTVRNPASWSWSKSQEWLRIWKWQLNLGDHVSPAIFRRGNKQAPRSHWLCKKNSKYALVYLALAL